MVDESNEMRGKLLASMDRPLLRALDNEGISDEFLVKKLKEELDANITKQFQHEGNVVTAEPVISWDVRQRARQDAHKLRGDYPIERRHVSFDGGVPIVPLSEDEQAELEAMKEVLKNKVKK